MNDDIPTTYLGRDSNAASFTKVVTSHPRARVIAIEAGYGFGKTMFQRKWAEDLRAAGETVIQFDAWRTDHSNDPLITFVAKLIENLPLDEKVSQAGTSKRKAALAAMLKVAKIATVTTARVAGGALAGDAMAEMFGDAADGDEPAKLAKEMAEAAGAETSKAVVGLVFDQLMAERVRQHELGKQLGILLEALESAKPEAKRKGRVTVIIDELDRCRPDYAVGLLEAIKHLFDQPGYKFVLMINPERLESTARMMFGGVESTGSNQRSVEPYFTKFMDIRLQLKAPDYAELIALQIANIESLYQPLKAGEAEYFDANGMIDGAAEILRRQNFSPREIERIFQLIEMTLTLADSREIDIRRLFVGALPKFRGRYAHYDHRETAAKDFVVEQNNIVGWLKKFRSNITRRRQLSKLARPLSHRESTEVEFQAGSIEKLLTHDEKTELGSLKNISHPENTEVMESIEARMENLSSDYHRDLIEAALEIVSDDEEAANKIESTVQPKSRARKCS